MRARILFVDDEEMVLRGIRRMFRPERGEWEMLFAPSAARGLEIMADGPVDVVVSDIKMPGMGGVEFLERVRDEYPQTVRIAMTGHSSADVAMLSALTVHRFLTKPCAEEDLRGAIRDSLRSSALLEDDALRRTVSRVHRLPSVPGLYMELTRALDKEAPSMEEVADVIARDVAMCAKVMQLVNSSFFGFARHIESPGQAVTLLGVNVIKSLVLSFHLFDEFDVDKTPGFTLEYLWEHSLRVSNMARTVCSVAGMPARDADHAFIAALLHDVGKLVLASSFAGRYNEVLGLVREGGRLMWQAEREVFGHTHAEVGAYLMGLWGLPGPVVDAIAFHHCPTRCPRPGASLAACHVANVFDHRLYCFSPRSVVPLLDARFLERMELLDMVPAWTEAARQYKEDLDACAPDTDS